MTDNQIANRQNTFSPLAQIVEAFSNGEHTPVITVTGGVIAIAAIGLLAYSIHERVHANATFGKWLSFSLVPEPDIQLTYIGDGLRVSDNT